MTWLVVVSIVVTSVILGFAARRLLLSVGRSIRQRQPFVGRVLLAVAELTPVILTLVVAATAVRLAPLEGYWSDVFRQILPMLVAVSIVWVALRVVGTIERGILKRHVLDVSDNLQARRVHTQTRILARTAMVLIVIIGLAICLMMIPGMRQVGAGLLASAGVAGLVIGLAAQPILGNLIAGLQLALTQPIRLDDVVIVDGEWGRIEEITGTYVVVAIWDQRRLVVPFRWFIDNPFQNWTRKTAQILGTVFLWLDFRAPMEEIRAEFERICRESPNWDGRVSVVQVTETGEWSMQVRLLISAEDSGRAFELRCEVREKILAFLQERHPQALPTLRAQNPVGSGDRHQE